MKNFNIPGVYRSSFITRIKNSRKDSDPRKKDFTPTLLDFGAVRFYLARHFGFCYGVENAIEIAYKTIEENPDKRIFLLSEMIHNPGVNQDLKNLGVKFIMDTSGQQLIDWEELTNEDIVIIPAFGTTLEIEEKLNELGIDPYQYNTTCPFVQRVWTRSVQLGKEDFTVIIHGKSYHEETRATFSHSNTNAKSLIIRDLNEAKQLASFILGEISEREFYEIFKEKYSQGFDAKKDLEKVGVVNQTTMLATETQAISDLLKETMIKKYGLNEIKNHYADTRDTLCYATNDNQDATYGLLGVDADFAIVVGGYNSSNTSHIVEICEEKLTTYFISSERKIISDKIISHFDLKKRKEFQTENYIPQKDVVTVLLTSGASCPDAVVESVLRKIHSFFKEAKDVDEIIESLLLKIE
ncbi:MAG TPA: 4-hydroxy-3-methylbut-2-enyl diphosphate reductase [Ignavibacteriaceae bacterium]|jgi:4-hydroxy-3-methylbut-2-enyl diphosphate reductase|nr:MAG: 4-hydroxy-3-methylbut-2-enyl diphosphate reductase [Ignavibacteria bacterium ADurb.Bin266]OQY72121.1 MAG: 4-hydroxy-3-methylbut-2-enyl diphosphate reductase [Ignavibacteriales bacterium UTCHB2]HQF42975.1 4-hydroxy-3-methylbut-2-enyl diphosphate reductase [Ignavibacteriaceae bacterium]HQI41214.1 4-hydroxy-3-methylbut-2-enyl diphosphate reductase [Ignavibacteriaceae bacterium]